MAEVEGKETNQMRQFIMKMAQEDEHFRASLAKDLTKLELDSGVDVKGAWFEPIRKGQQRATARRRCAQILDSPLYQEALIAIVAS